MEPIIIILVTALSVGAVVVLWELKNSFYIAKLMKSKSSSKLRENYSNLSSATI